ncbi:cytochrome P450 [Artemisia annua]|uniref:Cytochrome P450 n=1 Tax=Artemisia annua TaxID=35608 RepID=A0A2U1PSB1_ARTAN|nr:cytochrome P450 [Artemisia annua]
MIRDLREVVELFLVFEEVTADLEEGEGVSLFGELREGGGLGERFLDRWCYGLADTILMYLVHLGNVPTLVASSAETAQEIMKTHDISFSDRPILTMATILFYGYKDIIFSPYGEYWRQLKSIVVVHLLSNTRVKSFSNVREKEISHMISVIGESCGSLVDLSALFDSLTNNIICRVALGRTYPGLNFKDLLTDLVNIVGSLCVGDYFPWLSFFDRLSGLKGRAENLAKKLDDFFQRNQSREEETVRIPVNQEEKQRQVDSEESIERRTDREQPGQNGEVKNESQKSKPTVKVRDQKAVKVRIDGDISSNIE